jgi:hypothetical protein
MLQQLPQRQEMALPAQQPKQLQQQEQKAVATLLSVLVTCQMH